MLIEEVTAVDKRGFNNLWDCRVKIAGWLNYAAEWIDRPQSELESQPKFLDLAPTDAADEAGVYSDALFAARATPEFLILR